MLIWILVRRGKLSLTHKPLAMQNNRTSVESYQNLIRGGLRHSKNCWYVYTFSVFAYHSRSFLQNNVGNRYSPTVIVAAVTSRMEKHPLPTHVFINRNSGLQKNSIIMLEQIRTIDKSRLLEYIGHLDCRDMRAVDISLGISLDMVPESGGIFWEERQKQGVVLT